MPDLILKIVTYGGPFVIAVMGVLVSERKPKGCRRFAWYAAFFLVAVISVASAVLESNRSDAQLVSLSNNVTGGDSYAYVMPQTHAPVVINGEIGLPLVVLNAGNFQLTGVTIQIIDANNWSIDVLDAEFLRPNIRIPVLAAKASEALKGVLIPKPGKDGVAIYIINISAQNGSVTEVLKFRKGKNALPWATQYMVSKDVAVPGKENSYVVKYLKNQDQWSDDPEERKPTEAPDETKE